MKRKTSEGSPSDEKSPKAANVELTPKRESSEPAQKKLKVVSSEKEHPKPQDVTTPIRTSKAKTEEEDEKSAKIAKNKEKDIEDTKETSDSKLKVTEVSIKSQKFNSVSSPLCEGFV